MATFAINAAGSSEVVKVLGARFIESGAGTYAAQFVLPAGSTLLDIEIDAEALWAAGTSASLEVGDVADPDGFFTAIDLKAIDLLAGENLNFSKTGTSEAGAYFQVAASHGAKGLFNAAERTITATVVSVGAGTTGRTRVRVFFVTSGYTDITL